MIAIICIRCKRTSPLIKISNYCDLHDIKRTSIFTESSGVYSFLVRTDKDYKELFTRLDCENGLNDYECGIEVYINDVKTIKA